MYTELDYMTVADHKKEGDWPIEWLPVKGLIPYIKRLGPNAKGLEIGVARAESSYAILESCPNVTKFWGVDPYIAFVDWNGPVDQEHNDKTKEIAIKNMTEFGDRFKLHNMTSEDFHWLLEQDLFDFVFIDGDHSYEGVKKDLGYYYRHIRPGGLFAGHDYQLMTVRTALEEFRAENKIRLPVQVVDNNAWYMTVM